MACESLHSNAVKHQVHLEWTCCHSCCSLDSKFVWAFRSPFENSCRPLSVFRSNGDCEADVVPAFSTADAARLEIDSCAHLHIARRVGCGRLSEAPIWKVRIDAARITRLDKIHAIEDVENIQSKFEVEALPDLGHLLDGEVRIRVARVTELIWSFISFLSCLWQREIAAWKDAARTSREDSVPNFKVLAVVLLPVAGDTRIIVVVPIGIEIAEDDGAGLLAHCDGRAGGLFESIVPIAKQNLHGVGDRISDDEIMKTAGSEYRGSNGRGNSGCGCPGRAERDGWADDEKNSQSLILENRDGVVDFVDDGDVLHTQITVVG